MLAACSHLLAPLTPVEISAAKFVDVDSAESQALLYRAAPGLLCYVKQPGPGFPNEM